LYYIRYLGDHSEDEMIGHVACVGEKKNAYVVLVRKPEGKG
jgi:hypothetical protein